MHVLIVNFNLQGIDRSQYEEVCNEVAPAFGELPGLISKQWLADEDGNTYGGVYLWRDRQAMLDYKASEMFSDLSSNPAFTNLTATDFELLDGPSKVTGIG